VTCHGSDARDVRADVACALMRADADNLTFTLLAHRYSVKTRIARMGDARYREAYELAGATDILNIADMFMRETLFTIERPEARRIAELGRRQFVGLRFASDAELPALVRKVLDDRIADANAIKALVKTWRPDHLRA